MRIPYMTKTETRAMPQYTIQNTRVFFRQGTLPRQWGIAFKVLDVLVFVTGNNRYPYYVELSESEFTSAIELAESL